MAPSSQTTMEATVSEPWMWEMSKHSMRLGVFGEVEDVLEGVGDELFGGLEDAEALVVGLLGVLADEVDQGALVAALGGGELDPVMGALGEEIGEEGAIGKVDGDVDAAGDVGLVEVELLEEGGEEGGGGEDGAGLG